MTCRLKDELKTFWKQLGFEENSPCFEVFLNTNAGMFTEYIFVVYKKN